MTLPLSRHGRLRDTVDRFDGPDEAGPHAGYA